MGKAEILERIEGSGLPAGVKAYCADIIRNGVSSSLKDALKADAAKAIENIDRLLTAGSAILGCSKEEVLFTTGFNKNNRAPERFEAALAELRAANFLSNEGFSSLKLIGACPKKTADIFGVRGGLKYVFEVCCVRGAAGLAAAPAGRLGAKCDEKLVQVNSSRKEYGCERGGVVFVKDPYGLSAFADGKELKKLAGELHAGKNNFRSVHVCLISGGSAAVFPEWR